MKQALKSPHLWAILAIMTGGALVYYADQIPAVQAVVTLAPIQFARYSTHRILSIIPVAYAAFAFGFRGGVTTAIFISLALLPRAIFLTDHQMESIAENTAFLFIGLLVSWLIHRQQLAVSRLENAQQELHANVQVIKENEKRLAALNQISGTTSQSLELGQVLNSAIDSVVDVMRVDVALIFLLDEKAGELTLSAHRGVSDEFVQGVDQVKLGEGFNGRVAESGEPLFVEDASQDPRLTRATVAKHEIRSEIIVPLSSKDKVSGTLCVAMHSHRWFQPEEVDLLTAIGNQIGVAVENAHLYRQQQNIAQQLRLSEERYRGLFETSSEAIAICSAPGRIIGVNRACEQLTGYTQNELSATRIDEVFAATSRDIVKQLFSEESATIVETKELNLTRKDGTEAFVRLKATPLLRGSEVIGLQVIARDVTEERYLRQNMEYYVTQITKAQEDERLRISRELHDDTAQVLASLSRDLDSIISGEKRLPESTVQRLEKLHETTDSALEGVRRFSQDLRPSILDDLGLLPALEWLIADLEKRYDVDTKVSVTGNQRRLEPEKELAIFRIAQEALRNVRHSGASQVEMTTDFGEDALTLIIDDNGHGFNMPERTSDLALSGKLGIVGMRERARLIGGTLVVQSEVGSGTTLTLRMPG